MNTKSLEATWAQWDGPGLEHLRTPGGGLYRYEDEGVFRGFTVDLTVDGDGLVLDYPEIFRRMS